MLKCLSSIQIQKTMLYCIIPCLGFMIYGIIRVSGVVPTPLKTPLGDWTGWVRPCEQKPFKDIYQVKES